MNFVLDRQPWDVLLDEMNEKNNAFRFGDRS